MNPVPNPASNKKYAVMKLQRNQLARNAQWINTSIPRRPALIPVMVNSFGDIPTIFKSKIMNSVSTLKVLTLTHPRTNYLPDGVS